MHVCNNRIKGMQYLRHTNDLRSKQHTGSFVLRKLYASHIGHRSFF